MSTLLNLIGLSDLEEVHHNPSTPRLYEEIVRRREGSIAHPGPVVVRTGQYTGRSPGDKFIVREASSADQIWWSEVNRACTEEHFDLLFARLREYLRGREVFVQDCHAGADAHYRVSLRIVTERAWHSLFARNMFRRESDPGQREAFAPAWHLVYAPGFRAEPARDGTASEVFVLLHFGRRLILIGGTCYGGEMKKAIFTALNYILPGQGVLSMHCSANRNERGDTALFFGLSGTGKTTLSSSAQYHLIGDDEHGWSERGVFNFEGGCYAKVIGLDARAEPEIYAASQRFGTLLENVVVDPRTRRVDLDDGHFTENTRACYPLDYIPRISPEGMGEHPRNILMLTCDAFGVLPPVARLSPEQAMYHFICGYTAKVAGTERGITEPAATFSPCFGAPFMVRHPAFYARLLGEKIRRHRARCWLVNTGWSGGPYGEGERIRIAHTRAIVAAILDRRLDEAAVERDPIFGLEVPRACGDLPARVLSPRATWKNPRAYDAKARELARRFNQHFALYQEQLPHLEAVAPDSA